MPKDRHDDLDTGDPLLPPGAGPGPDGPTLEEVLAYLHGKPPPPPRAAATGLVSPAEAAWADLIAGPDPVEREAVDARLGEFRAALGPAASPLEQLLAESVGVAWLEVTFFGAARPRAWPTTRPTPTATSWGGTPTARRGSWPS